MTDHLPVCREIIGVPMGARLRGDERICGRPATRYIYDKHFQLRVQVCPRHAVWYRKHGWDVKELLAA